MYVCVRKAGRGWAGGWMGGWIWQREEEGGGGEGGGVRGSTQAAGESPESTELLYNLKGFGRQQRGEAVK